MLFGRGVGLCVRSEVVESFWIHSFSVARAQQRGRNTARNHVQTYTPLGDRFRHQMYSIYEHRGSDVITGGIRQREWESCRQNECTMARAVQNRTFEQTDSVPKVEA